MKFKYYLRGAGIGLIVSAVILMIAFSKYNKKITDDEIIKRAQELGMVMDDSTSDKDDESDSNKPSDNEDDGDNDNQGEGDNTGEDNPDSGNDDGTGDSGDDGDSDNNDDHELVWFQIKNGEFSDVISNHLYEKGLIDDPVKYNEWLMKNGYDADLVTGTFMIPRNSTYEEIAKILTCTGN